MIVVPLSVFSAHSWLPKAKFPLQRSAYWIRDPISRSSSTRLNPFLRHLGGHASLIISLSNLWNSVLIFMLTFPTGGGE